MKESSDYCSQRLKWIDVLKGIGMILVLVGHIYNNRIVHNWLYSFHMPLFFFVAGYCCRKRDIFIDIRRRIQSIVIPYFSFGVLILIYWQLIERQFRNSDISFSNSILGLFLGEYEYLDFNVHLWFLPCFFVTVVFYNLLLNIGGKKLAYGISIVMSIVYILFDLPELPWGTNRVFQYIGFYAVGNLLVELKMEQVIRNIVLNISVGVGLLAVNFFLSFFHLITGVFWFITALFGVAAIAIVSFTIDHNRELQYLGKSLLIILCIYGPVYRGCTKIVSVPLRMSTDTVRGNFFLVMLIVAVTAAVCCVAYEIAVKILPWMIGKQIRPSGYRSD